MGSELNEAYIFVKAGMGKESKIKDEIRKLKRVESIRMVVGIYDFIVFAKAGNLDEITNLVVNEIQEIEGVKDTYTSIVTR